MLKRGYLLFVLLVGSLVLMGTGGTSAADDAEARAGKFIESLADKAIAALTEKDVLREQRLTRFRDLLDEHFAVDTIGRWVLGRHWNDATEPERKEYLSLFEDLIVVTYVDRFNSYSGENTGGFQYGAGNRGDLLSIRRSPGLPAASPLDVAWRVRDYDGRLKIVDVIVAGRQHGPDATIRIYLGHPPDRRPGARAADQTARGSQEGA